MGSVTDYNVECPNCKIEEAIEDFYYKTGEVYVMCPNCGYTHINRFKRNEDGEVDKIDPNGGYEYDNLVKEEILIDKPYGAYYITSKDGMGNGGSLETETQYQEFVSEIVSLTNQPNDIESVKVSRLINGKIEVENIYP